MINGLWIEIMLLTFLTDEGGKQNCKISLNDAGHQPKQMLLEASKPAQTSSIQLWHCWSFPGLRAIGARLHWIPVNIAVIYDRQLGCSTWNWRNVANPRINHPIISYPINYLGVILNHPSHRGVYPKIINSY